MSAIPDAVERALDEGSLSLERLQDAAARTAELAAVRTSAGADPPTLGQLDEIAARCLEVVGAIPRLDRPLVVEARPPGGMASGELPWSLAEPLARRMSGVTALDVRAGEAAGRAREQARGRSLVLVVRDAARHDWQGALLDAARVHPNAVVVDVGWPDRVPDVPCVRTRGIAPGLLTAAAELLSSAA